MWGLDRNVGRAMDRNVGTGMDRNVVGMLEMRVGGEKTGAGDCTGGRG